MAIDSEQKRKSAATVSTYYNPPSVIADGAFDQADRQHAGWGYSGILAGGAVAPSFIAAWARYANVLLDGAGVT